METFALSAKLALSTRQTVRGEGAPYLVGIMTGPQLDAKPHPNLFEIKLNHIHHHTSGLELARFCG
jgi:hypothetical protein